ncbi:zinc-dependent alcohol dehydrogenase family protein [Salinigranum halophilum]|jgi:alcohol dehydrogenase|uniref:zinc-dependent alcohol dehydrogenase family protein n=1 Tax=Salinigranum halophilum TaxID=2565931 RepID=UPI00115C7F54|nr:zinc-dependent alcohol dehydrogenase family protein [Salinigranum halophilum]
MRAAVLTEYGEPLSIRSLDAPSPTPEGVVVRVEACGICRSDWHAWQGHGEWADDRVPRGQVLGHEPAGTVVEVGDQVRRYEVGDRVAVPFNLGDGSCSRCLSGHGNRCADGHALGFESAAPGAFAERVHVPRADYNLLALPDGVDPVDVAALGCRFMTAYHALAHRVSLPPGSWVAVHGCGGVGLSALSVASAAGHRTVAVDVRDEALALAAEVGATVTVDASRADAVDEIRAVTDGGADVSLDALGRAETCRNSVRSVRPGGTHVQVGLTTDAERGEVSLPTDWMTRWEVSFVGSRGMPPTRYDELFGLVESGAVTPEALVTREVSLGEVSERLAAMTDYGTVGVEVVTEF